VLEFRPRWRFDPDLGAIGVMHAWSAAVQAHTTLGIVGAGTQARLQASLITRLLGLKHVLVWSRDSARAAELAARVMSETRNDDVANGERVDAAAASLANLCAQSDLIVTTTPATRPLLMNDMIRAGTRIVAVGADSPGKQELDEHLIARARLVVDSRAQCVDHGEVGWAVRAGLVAPDTLIELGALLQNPIDFSEEEDRSRRSDRGRNPGRRDREERLAASPGPVGSDRLIDRSKRAGVERQPFQTSGLVLPT
jgi:ornithine cyclodeaminase/alanine dehydrogenase-like protein (mu-crystallin family)